MNVLKSTLLATAMIAAGTSTAFAATSTQTFNVKIEITSVCEIATATDVDFGSVDSNASNVLAASSLNVKCTKGTPYDIGLDAGSSVGATVATRKMKHSNVAITDLVPYSLYSDAGRTLNWGDTVSTDTVHGTGTGAVVAVPVYGEVLDANFSAGTYNDVVTATVTW